METTFEASKGLHASEALRSNFSDASSVDSLEGFTDLGGVWTGHPSSGVHRGVKVVTLTTDSVRGGLRFEGRIYGLHHYSNVSSGPIHINKASTLDINGAISTTILDGLRVSHLVVQEHFPTGATGKPTLLDWTSSHFQREPNVQALIDRIRRYQHLATDWSGEDTIMISDVAVSAATLVIDATCSHSLPLPKPSPSSDGEIGLTWYRGRDAFDLIIEPNARMGWITRVDRKVDHGKVITVASSSFPTDIIEALREFYGTSKGKLSLR